MPAASRGGDLDWVPPPALFFPVYNNRQPWPPAHIPARAPRSKRKNETFPTRAGGFSIPTEQTRQSNDFAARESPPISCTPARPLIWIDRFFKYRGSGRLTASALRGFIPSTISRKHANWAPTPYGSNDQSRTPIRLPIKTRQRKTCCGGFFFLSLPPARPDDRPEE